MNGWLDHKTLVCARACVGPTRLKGSPGVVSLES